VLRKLEKYEILSEIGHGGMATVYRARDSRLEREVAVKILHPHLRGASEARARFTREARSVARLRHPNILEIYDNADETSDESYIVTELLTGPTLKAFVEETGPMPAEVAACFALEIARALGAAHAAGIVHRDVKPENVLVHERRVVKLTDFGIAQMIDSQPFTATGQILGSPGHMAPEQVDGADCDARTDVFSLGTVLYYLATAELPFQGRTPHQILRRIIDCDYPDPVRLRPQIGERLGDVIRKSLAKDPAARFQTAEDFERVLAEFVGEVGITDPESVVARYLVDPKAVTAEFDALVVDRLPGLATLELERKQMPLALAYMNRVLAFDEKNPAVLAMIDKLGRRRRVRAWVVASGALLGIAGLVGLGALVLGGRPPAEGAVTNVREGASLAAPDAVRATAATGSSTVPARATEPRAGGSNPGRAQPTGPREVVFDPFPQNVSISVDGGALTPFGPSFRSVNLSPGKHTFRFVGAENCCEDEVISRVIAPSDSPYTFDVRLRFKPALLYVSANVLGDVVVDDGKARGRTRSVIPVAMERSLLEGHRVQVLAPGHRPFTTEVKLRAGRDYELKDVRLEPFVGSP
jgi:hypothetical protein